MEGELYCGGGYSGIGTAVYRLWHHHGTVYYHDKNILTGTTYETAVIAGRKQKRESPFSEEEVKQLWRERISGKMILFRKAEVEIRCHKEYVSILAQASRKKLRITASAKAALTDADGPDRSMRNKRMQ